MLMLQWPGHQAHFLPFFVTGTFTSSGLSSSVSSCWGLSCNRRYKNFHSVQNEMYNKVYHICAHLFCNYLPNSGFHIFITCQIIMHFAKIRVKSFFIGRIGSVLEIHYQDSDITGSRLRYATCYLSTQTKGTTNSYEYRHHLFPSPHHG